MKFLLSFLFITTLLYSRDVVDYKENCEINWTKGFISCTSESAEGQKKYAAKISAKGIVKRDLLEVIKGVQITSDMKIEDGLLASEIITSRVEGLLRGVQVSSVKYNSNSGSAVATARIEMGKDLLSALLSDPTKLTWNEKIKDIFENFSFLTEAHATSNYTIKDKETLNKILVDLKEIGDTKGSKYLENKIIEIKNIDKYSGILIDVSNLNDFKKAMIVKLVNEYGTEIYPSDKVSKNVLTKRNTSVGFMYGYDDAKNNERIFNTPLELKVSKVYKNKKSNIVLNSKQISELKLLDPDILSEAKIMLVLGE